MVLSLSESVLYSHSQEKSNVIFKDRREIMKYMDLSRREYLGFILINMGFQKLKHRHSKLASWFWNSTLRFKITRIKSC
jgi:hypothetical protein